MKQFVRFLLATAFMSTVGLWLSTASFWHSVDAPEEKPKTAPSIIIDVTPQTKLVVDQILITQHAEYSILHVRCRWIGDNISENYESRPSLEGIDHKESKEGSVWYSAMMKSPTDQRPGYPFTLDIKNPPAQFDSLPFKITLKQRANRWWIDVPRLSPVSFLINRHDIGFQSAFQQ